MVQKSRAENSELHVVSCRVQRVEEPKERGTLCSAAGGAHLGHPPARAAFRMLFNVQQSQIAIKLLECFICLVQVNFEAIGYRLLILLG